MELLNPKLTVQNTDQQWYIVRMEHRVSDCEHIDVQLKVPRLPQEGLAALQARLLRQAMGLLQAMTDSLERCKPTVG